MDVSLEDLDGCFREGIARRASVADEQGRMPAENWRDIVESGYLRLFHPAAIGGLETDGVTQAKAMESLARACAGTYWSATMSTLLCGKLISTYGDVGEHRRLLTPILGGERLGCFAVVEKTAGSDPGTYRTMVRRRGGDYVINGEKAKITNAPTADLAVVLSRLDDEPGWCFAFVDLRQEGVAQYRTPTLGLRAMPWGGVSFDDVPVRHEDVVPVPYSEFAEGMAWGWLFISIAAIATADNAMRASARHASEQVAFGRPLAHMEGVQAQLADMRAEIEAARLMAWRASWHRTRGRSARDLIAMLKVYATEMAVRVTQRAVQIHGAAGLTAGTPVERYYRDAPMNVIGGFASNRLRELIVDDVTASEPDYHAFDWLAPSGLAQDLGKNPTLSLARAEGREDA